MANSNDKAAAATVRQKLLRPEPVGSLEELTNIYCHQRELLSKDVLLLKFRKQLEELLVTHPNAEASHVVCLGLGPLSQPYSAHEHTSLQQLIHLENAIEVLNAHHRLARPQYVYFQDMAFSQLDTLFLISLGYHVIPWPARGSPETLLGGAAHSGRSTQRSGSEKLFHIGINHHVLPSAPYLDEATFLFAPHLEFITTLQAVHQAMPSVFLGNNFPECGPEHWIHQEDAETGKIHKGFLPGLPKELDLSYLEHDWKQMLQRLDWTVPVTSRSDDSRWCNDIVLAVHKVPNSWTVNSEYRQGELAQRALNAAALDEKNSAVMQESVQPPQESRETAHEAAAVMK